MARVRMETEPILQSWDDVNMNLKEIAECEMALEAIEAQMNAAIQDLKLDAELQAKPLQEKAARLAREIKEFTEENRSDIKGKTMKLNFGQCGFRQSTKITIASVQATLKSLKARGMKDCIMVKESVNKDTLREYPDEVIASVGCRKKIEDAFWFETDREKLIQARE